MNKFYTETLHKLETEINDLEIETDHSIQRIEAVIDIILKYLSEVKKYVLQGKWFQCDISYYSKSAYQVFGV